MVEDGQRRHGRARYPRRHDEPPPAALDRRPGRLPRGGGRGGRGARAVHARDGARAGRPPRPGATPGSRPLCTRAWRARPSGAALDVGRRSPPTVGRGRSRRCPSSENPIFGLPFGSFVGRARRCLPKGSQWSPARLTPGAVPATGSLENPEVVENVPGHVIPILEREFDDFDTESTRYLEGRADRGRVHQVPPQAGRLRPAPARRADGPRQAPDGRRHARAARGLRRRDREVRAAAQGPHHHPPEHPDAPHPAARRGQADPRARRRRPVLARGLRQHDAQRDGRPAGRRARRRAVRHHPLRGRLRALLRPPSDDAGDAAQGQDGVHRHRRRQRDHRHPRHGVHPPRARRRARRRGPGRRRHLDHAADRAHAVRVRRARQRRLSQGHRGVHADLRPPGLPARQPRPRAHQGAGRQGRHRRVPRAWSKRSWRATGWPSATSRSTGCCFDVDEEANAPRPGASFDSPNGDRRDVRPLLRLQRRRRSASTASAPSRSRSAAAI